MENQILSELKKKAEMVFQQLLVEWLKREVLEKIDSLKCY